jgi:hypothetical protein
MTSLGSRRLLLSGNELKERGRREAPLLFVVAALHEANGWQWDSCSPIGRIARKVNLVRMH